STKSTDSSFFFFQAEDGIRDFHVTGVQTCALPISCTWWATTGCRPCSRRAATRSSGADAPRPEASTAPRQQRLEFRQVGRERAQIGRASCRERGESAAGRAASEEQTRQQVDREGDA